MTARLVVSGPEIVTYARTLLGTPYHHQARTPGVGIDCIGVGVAIARHFGWPHRDREAYSRKPDGRLIEYLRYEMDEIPIAAAAPGDLMAFWFERRGLPQHTAIRTDYGILHAIWLGRRAPNRVVEHVYSPDWVDRTMAAFRFRQG